MTKTRSTARAARPANTKRNHPAPRVGILFLLLAAHSADLIAAPATFPEAPAPGIATFANLRGGVRVLLVHGDTLYAGGNFRVSQGGVTRTNLAAFDLGGNLRPEFSATPNGTVLALATDGISLFVGGEFSRLDLKKRLAAVDLVTGKVNRYFTVHVQGATDIDQPTAVRALAVVTDAASQPPTRRLVVGGNFSRLNEAVIDNRLGLAAVATDSGNLDPGRFTLGIQDGFVDAMIASKDGSTLYVGGAFTSFQGRASSLVALDATGAVAGGMFRGGTQPIIDLDLDEAGNRLFAASGGGSNRALAFTASGTSRGQLLWRGPRAGGDVQAIHYVDGNVYFGFHDGLFVEPDPFKMAAVDAGDGTLIVDLDHPGLGCSSADADVPNCWLPVMDQTSGGQGFFGLSTLAHVVDAVTGKARLIAGGEFTQIGGISNTRRLAIFQEP